MYMWPDGKDEKRRWRVGGIPQNKVLHRFTTLFKANGVPTLRESRSPCDQVIENTVTQYRYMAVCDVEETQMFHSSHQHHRCRTIVRNMSSSCSPSTFANTTAQLPPVLSPTVPSPANPAALAGFAQLLVIPAVRVLMIT